MKRILMLLVLGTAFAQEPFQVEEHAADEVSITLTAADMMTVAKNAYTCGVLDGSVRAVKGTSIETQVRALAKESEEICGPLKVLLGIGQ